MTKPQLKPPRKWPNRRFFELTLWAGNLGVGLESVRLSRADLREIKYALGRATYGKPTTLQRKITKILEAWK